MAADNPNASVIAYIEAKIAAWQAVLTSLKSALAIDPGGQTIEGFDLSSVGQSGDLGQPMDLPDGAFHGKSIPACVKLYLSAAKKKKTIKEIAAALREGGVESTADNFESPVATALNRLKAAGEVLRFKDGWGLSTWYPPNLRGTVPANGGKRSPKSKKKGKKAHKGKVAAAKAAIPIEPPVKVADITKAEDKPELKIIAFFKANRREVSAKDVASALGLKIQTTNLVLAKLAHQKKIEKSSSGAFKSLGGAAS